MDFESRIKACSVGITMRTARRVGRPGWIEVTHYSVPSWSDWGNVSERHTKAVKKTPWYPAILKGNLFMDEFFDLVKRGTVAIYTDGVIIWAKEAAR